MEFKRMKEYFFHMYLITASKNLTMLGFFRMGHTCSLVNKSGYLRLNDFCTEYILTQCCLHYLNQTHQKLGDLKEKLRRFS